MVAEGPGVLDSTALLHWPLERLAKGVCSPLQLEEVERLSPARRLLVEGATIDWRTPSEGDLRTAREAAAASGDLPRLSPVDLEVLALALGGPFRLVTDDYRLQNVAMRAGLEVESIATAGASAVWAWVWRCTGCRREHHVEADASLSVKDDGPECDVCGSRTVMKRRRG